MLLIVIVNYRTPELTIDCLRSLGREVGTVSGTEVVVVDSHSGDGSAERIQAAVDRDGWGSWASIRALDRNRGFSAGNNEAIRPAIGRVDAPRFVLLLNPDTVVHPGALRTLVEFMESRPDVGIAGSRLEEPDGTPQRSAFRFPTVLGELEGGLRLGLASRILSRWICAPEVPASSGPTDWVSGACLIIRREVFEAIGLMDEGYFLYYEEVDFCHRARRAGWPCWYVPAARVVHLIGQSSGFTNTSQARKRRPGYWFVARRRYFRNNHGRFAAALANLAWLSGYISYRVRRVVQNKPDTDPRWMLWDFIRYNFLWASR
jgi:N-acetylglucosaminyl-diphospho-decaprenol L-rhamnosyltransferase